jgi:hypothetical protein
VKKTTQRGGYDLYPSPILFEINGVGGACSRYGGEERCIQGLDGKT